MEWSTGRANSFCGHKIGTYRELPWTNPELVRKEYLKAEGQEGSRLLEKLTTPEELSGFLNKAIAAYREMDTRGAFTGEGTTEQKRDYYTRLSDPVHCFVEDCILFDPESMVVKQRLYMEFRAYAQKRGYGKTFTQKRFFKKFREKAGEQLYESYVKDSDGVQRRIYKGIKLEAASQTNLREAALT